MHVPSALQWSTVDHTASVLRGKSLLEQMPLEVGFSLLAFRLMVSCFVKMLVGYEQNNRFSLAYQLDLGTKPQGQSADFDPMSHLQIVHLKKIGNEK